MNADLGVYVQDSWRVTDRLTISPGVRFDYLNASIEARTADPGRFVPFRQFPDVANLPNWFTVSPRLGVAYDLTGDARTALKGTINRYQRGFTADIAIQYDPMFLQSDIRNWSDCDYSPGTSRCSGLVLPTNGDDIAQDNEIGPSNNRRFGAAPDRIFDPDSKRPYDMEYTLGVEREFRPGMSLGATWFLRQSYNFQQTINLLVNESDYSSFQVPNPLGNGEMITIYNLNPAKQGLISLFDTTADRDDARASFQGVELTLRARLPNGGAMLGGWSAGKTIRVTCANFSDPNTFRFCDHSQLDIPWRHSFKVSGSYPVPLGMIVGVTAHSNAGFLLGSNVTDGSLATNWNVPANLFPGGRTQAVTVRLDEPGSQYLERWNQLDFSVKRAFRVNAVQLEPAVEIFNAFNVNAVLVQNQNFGSSLGQPQRVLQGRLMRLAFQLTF
jgi:outer membrane receptor protein involved in Fe transport